MVRVGGDGAGGEATDFCATAVGQSEMPEKRQSYEGADILVSLPLIDFLLEFRITAAIASEPDGAFGAFV
jgi:hypothetical protein